MEIDIMSIYNKVSLYFSSITKDPSFKKKLFLGYLLAVFAAVLNGLADILPKPILEGDGIAFSGLSPIVMTAIIFLINGVVFTGLAKKTNPVKDVGKRNFWILIVIGIAEITATTTFYFGLRETSAVNTVILSNTDFIFTTILAMIIFSEAFRRKESFPLSLIVFGAILIPVFLDLGANNFQMSQLVFGDFLVILAGLFYGIEMNLFRYVSDKVDAKRILQIISFVAGGIALLIAILLQLPINLRLIDMPSILVTGVLGIGLSILLLVIAVKYIGAIRTMLIFTTQTLFGMLFAHFYLGEELQLFHFVAFAAVFSGIAMLCKKSA
jgi:drug/metabolite transporter (DMT)-like permease